MFLCFVSVCVLPAQEADVEAVQTQLTKLGFVVADNDVKNALRTTGMHIGKVTSPPDHSTIFGQF